MKKVMISMIALLCLLVSGCGAAKQETQPTITETQQAAETTAAPSGADYIWSVSLLETERSKGLHTTASVVQYDRSTMDVAYDSVPSSGNAYVILKLEIAKNKPGNAAFTWANLSLIDGQGNAYSRIEDMFLQDHGYERLSGTDLKLGTNTGWICFEVPKEQASQPMTLCYTSEEGEQKIEIQ